MPIGEPPSWSAERKARLAAQFPVQFTGTDASTVIGVDSMNVANGKAPSDFSVQAMRLAGHAGSLGK